MTDKSRVPNDHPAVIRFVKQYQHSGLARLVGWKRKAKKVKR